jgi:hypothetical protein
MCGRSARLRGKGQVDGLAFLACTLWFANAAAAQQVTSSRFLASGTVESSPVASVHGMRAFTPIAPTSLIRGAELRSVARQRAVHAGYGALIGAVVGGVLGLIADQQDHTGEGLIAPVMIGAGAVVGAIPGALVGLLLPVHREPTT